MDHSSRRIISLCSLAPGWLRLTGFVLPGGVRARPTNHSPYHHHPPRATVTSSLPSSRHPSLVPCATKPAHRDDDDDERWQHTNRERERERLIQIKLWIK
uniref:Putative secreted protein n=1 Tax=Anopheles darlingi TaxID=43151 RepID=A0A2M4D4C3_ANODA